LTIGSPALLRQLTTNLVHNAIVHNLPDQGTVSVATSVHPDTVVLTVENTGEPLTPQLASTLVEPFQRGTNRLRSDHPGVGLGLAIVNRITQAHHGTLTLTPRPTGGLRATVQLPPPPPPTDTRPSENRRTPEPHPAVHDRRFQDQLPEDLLASRHAPRLTVIGRGRPPLPQPVREQHPPQRRGGPGAPGLGRLGPVEEPPLLALTPKDQPLSIVWAGRYR
jgi:Histidine kinase-, DNA gyrase B-, and HSP90-like ATPase